MRTYHQNSSKKVRNKKALWYGIGLGLGAVAIAMLIILSVALGGVPEVDVDGPAGEVVVPPEETKTVYVLPVANFTLGDLCVLDKLVYNASMNSYMTHDGVDFLASEGESVFVVADGKVVSVVNTELDATVVTIEHADGMQSIYMGLSTDVKVADGDTVKAGDTIGSVNDVLPRSRADGSHLHLQFKLDGVNVDPLLYLPDIGEK